MPDVFDTIESAMRTLQERLSVSTVYGEPVSANGVTVIPVSKVSFGFGGGGGSGVAPRGVSGETLAGNGDATLKTGSGSGGGMGGGGTVEPLGYIEISDAGSRWVPLEPPRGELFLRVLAVAPALLPTGRGRGGLLRRLLLLLAGQALLGRVLRPGMPEGMRGRLPLPRRAAEEPA